MLKDNYKEKLLSAQIRQQVWSKGTIELKEMQKPTIQERKRLVYTKLSTANKKTLVSRSVKLEMTLSSIREAGKFVLAVSKQIF